MLNSLLNQIIKNSITQRWLIVIGAILITLWGIVNITQMPLDVFPEFAPPQVDVQTEVPGLAPEEIEAQITVPIESAVNGLPGVTTVRSSSKVGLSMVQVVFDQNADIYKARQAVTERLQQISGQFPENAHAPEISPLVSPLGTILQYAFTVNGQTSLMELRRLVEGTVSNQILSVPGVSQVTVYGGDERQEQVLVDPEKLRSLNVSLTDVTEAAKGSNSNAPGGFLIGGGQELLIRGIGKVQTIEDLQTSVVKVKDGEPILLKDVATVQTGSALKRGDGSFNGQPAVVMMINKQPDVDTPTVTKAVETVIASLETTFPADVNIARTFRQANFIDAAIRNVSGSLIQGIIIVSVIMLLFLMNWRTAMITLSAIPLSLIIGLLFMKAFGLGINTMTLGGLVVAIGSVVDDSIVDMENCYRGLRNNQAQDNPKHPFQVVYDTSVQTITQVSLSTSTNFDGDLNALVEDLGNALTVRFDLDGPAPEGGLKVFVDSNVEQIVNRLDLPGFAFNPITENIKPALFGTSFDNSGFYLTIDEGATFGTFTIDVFDNPEPDTFLPETFDGLVEAVFELKTEVAPEDLADVGTLGDYTIDPNAAASTVLFVDDESQLSEISEPPPPEPPELDVLQVSLFTGPSYLIEDEVTVSAHAFNVTNGTIPEGGLVVSVDAPNLSEFDLAGISVDGGTIEAVRDGGFDLRMTQYTTLVNLPIADDGETETGETASFSLAPGDGYEIVEDYSGGSFNLVDTRSDIPRGVVTEPNDIVSLATDTQITPENPSFFAVDSIYFDIGNRYLNEDGTYTYVDYNEDVDLYKLELTAGDTIAVETFEVEGNRDVNNRFGNLSGVAIFDAEGNRLISSGLYTPAAPDKLFGVGEGAFRDDGTVVESETDTYLEFTASEDGIYYVGVSSYLSATPVSYGREDLAYDIEIPASGDDNRVAFGLYELEINLLTEDNPRKTGTPTPPVSNPNVINPPTLSLGANPTTVDSEGNFTSAVVEFVELGGISGVNFTIQAEGEIPEEGIEFVLNSDVNLFDYVSYLGQDELPTTVGGQSLGAYYNEEGIPTGIRLRIDEPTMTVNLERANRNPVIAFQHDTTGFYDLFEGLETDGPEDVTFFLQPGEGYEVAPEIGTTEVTYYDSLADVPPPSGGDVVPEVGLTVSETFLIESEETETTFSFTLSEAPPEGGITVFVDSEDEPFLGSILGQFSVLEAEIEGGNFPVPNSDESGFFFTITDQTATITVSVFDELTVIDNPVTVQEGLFDITFALQPQEGYTIDSDASEITLTIADNPDSKIQVGLTGSPASLIESEETVSVHTFTLSSPPPEEGLTVSVSADALDEFNLDAIDTAGGTIAEVRDDGFDFNITEREATINLPVLDDGVEEGSETALFSLDPSENYLINQAIPQASFAIADTPDQASVSEEIEGNSTIAEANALGLSSQTPTVSINGTLAATGPSNQTPERWLGFAEDVDMYAITLEAGQTVSLDIDTGEPTPANNGFTVYPALVEMPQKTDTELRLFDAQGNELAANSDGAAPGEEFSRDPYLEFTAETAGTYYVGVSLLGNRNYDPNVVRSGSGWTFPEIGVFYGDYELTATLEESSPESMLPVFGSLDGETFDAGVTPGFDGTDDILFGGSGDDFIDTVAGNGGNRLYGQSGDDTFILGHNDRAFAGAGDDSFFLLGGNNVVTGGAGSDSFWLAVAEIPEAANTITDFDLEADVLGIAGLGIGFDGLTISEENGDTLIATGDDELAKLLGVSAGSLSADHFVFG